jgi:ribonucleoside-diphosphate reductase alpha chain
LEQKEKYSNQTNVDKIGRAIGMALRHNIPIVDIVETLEKYSDGLSTLIFHIKKVLSEYIKDGTRIENRTCSQCGSESLVYQGGCVTCINCGNSKCT